MKPADAAHRVFAQEDNRVADFFQDEDADAPTPDYDMQEFEGDDDEGLTHEAQETDVDECQVGFIPNAVDRSTYPTVPELHSFIETQKQSMYSDVNAFYIPLNNIAGSKRFVNPCQCIDNEGQRIFICSILLQLQMESQYVKPSPFRAEVVGVAGTGKSYVMQIVTAILRLYTGHNMINAYMLVPRLCILIQGINSNVKLQ